MPCPPLKPIDPLRELERGVTVRNGVVRLRACTSVKTTYFCFVMEYEALADERRGNLIELWINPDARSLPDWPASLLEAAEPRDAILGSDLSPRLQAAATLAGRLASVTARHDLNDFLESLERRRAGDLRRLREYFDDIYQEIGRKAQRATRLETRAEMRRLDAAMPTRPVSPTWSRGTACGCASGPWLSSPVSSRPTNLRCSSCGAP